MTSVCKKCKTEIQGICPRCSANRTNCWPWKRKDRYVYKKAVVIKCSFSSNNP